LAVVAIAVAVAVAVLATDDNGCDVIAQRVWRSGLVGVESIGQSWHSSLCRCPLSALRSPYRRGDKGEGRKRHASEWDDERLPLPCPALPCPALPCPAHLHSLSSGLPSLPSLPSSAEDPEIGNPALEWSGRSGVKSVAVGPHITKHHESPLPSWPNAWPDPKHSPLFSTLKHDSHQTATATATTPATSP
jgi:hypothetical protein